jgi:hypothetical protein
LDKLKKPQNKDSDLAVGKLSLGLKMENKVPLDFFYLQKQIVNL